MKDTFKYLDIPPVEAITVHDDFDCHSKCLENSKCHSINVAASKAADGKLWCELLSSDKYRNVDKLKANKSSHYYCVEVILTLSPKINNLYISSSALYYNCYSC